MTTSARAAALWFSLISEYQLEDFPALRLGDVYSASTATGVDLRAELLTQYR
ncbi:hypothetical protein ACGFIW_27580 [Micromonospora sp. NPDC048935]|uniref:hypothetical protein n=1 Tax=Micromonospora sp. NPDC048935 TaxID=3364262 RepID=UPI0037198576